MQHTCICDDDIVRKEKKHKHSTDDNRPKTQNKTRRLNGYLKMGAMNVCIDA